VSSLTFIAPANAIRYAGAHPVFVDAEPDYWQMDVTRVAAFLQEQGGVEGGCLRNRKTGRRVSAIVPVHILGHPVDMAPLLEVARRYGLRVIEDCAESLGARYRGQRVGAMGDFGCLSFNGNKTITTGGGGMLLTNNPEMARRAKYLTTQAKDDPEEYIHHEVGYNYRLVNLLAALGCAQLEQLDGFITRKRETARRYQEAFAPVPGMYLPREAPWAKSIFWLFSVGVQPETFGIAARQLRDRLKRAQIQTRPLWQPLHRSPAFAQAAEAGMPCPVAEKLYREVLSLPSSPGLTPAEQTRVIRGVLNHGGMD
jgi:perosamine synthetase